MKAKEITKDKLSEAIREFLEQHPLYAPLRFVTLARLAGSGGDIIWDYSSVWPKALTLRCQHCQSDTSWRLVEATKGNRDIPFKFYDKNYLLRYVCALCDAESAAFWCSAESDDGRSTHVLRKQGQSPAWSIEPPQAIAKALPQDVLAFYRQGLICLSHNFGLGAAAYFRRVVEQATNHILDLVEKNASEVGDEATVIAVNEARTSYQATERLRFAANNLPLFLRPGGRNPLALLYESYSEGIHSLSDEECLEVALEVRANLDFILPQLHEQLAASRAYQAALARSGRRKGSSPVK